MRLERDIIEARRSVICRKLRKERRSRQDRLFYWVNNSGDRMARAVNSEHDGTGGVARVTLDFECSFIEGVIIRQLEEGKGGTCLQNYLGL